ncbi:MAG TPA: hypothetical protein VMV75_01650, partial [Sulfuricella sp.]|nr:hypothetical protein [Sulfuricella sp.]
TGVSNFTHGTGYLDGNGFVHYNPSANYYGPASFSYTIQAPTGQTDTATVDINLLNVNDAPTATVDQHVRAIYGYASMDTTYDENGNPVYTPSNPQYSPYQGCDYSAEGWLAFTGYHSTPIEYKDIDGPNVGTVVASDIDDPNGPFTYKVIAQPQFGDVEVDANGGFHYFSWSGPNTRSGKDFGPTDPNAVYGNTGPKNSVWVSPPFQDPFAVQVTDAHGASTTLQVNSVHYGNYNPNLGSGGGGGGGCCPISIDLDRNGFGFSNVDDSNVFFDINGDGWKEKVSWVSPGDGLLAYDADGNGKIESGAEVSFAAYKTGAQSDLEGLRAFDSNNDGIFSASDEKWSKFGIWQDANQNGVTDPGEFKSLDALGVDSINLTSDNQFSVINGTTVQGVAKVTMTDGSTLDAADFTLRYTNDILVNNPDGTSQVVTRSPFSPSGEELNGTDGNDLILGKTGNNIVNAGAGDDVVMEDGGNDVIDGGDGNDTIYSGADNDLVMAGAGDDVVFAGLGNDMVLGGDGNDALFGEGGNDVIFGGKGNDLISGDSGNDVLSGDAGDDQVYGGSGNDALFGGAGNDELAGMDGYDRLDGGAGNDLLDGGADADEMIGGAGDDIYVVDNAGDIVTENPDEGIDTVRSSISYVLGANLENLTLTGTENLSGTGNDADNVLIGNSGANTLTAGAGNDTLDGGLGADTLIGGTGDDIYVVDNAADIVFERPDEGTDTVLSSVSYALTDNVENLVLTGRSAIDATGNTLDNVLTGNVADNILDGGIGADIMAGGRGNDTYVVDNTGDRTIELANEGVDTVVSSLSWTLADNVENLVLTGTDNLSGTGNELDNVLVGNAGNNRIDGGLGADTMAGGAGDDVYVVDNTNDAIIEAANGGNDSVFASASYALSDNVENLTLTGIDAIDGSGNVLDNVIVGNSGNNFLDGGAGADALTGGAGNDTYVVDNVGDTVAELADEGIDTVRSSIDYALGANVENLTLTGMADLNGTGNELDNVIVGNAGNNVLLGEAGNDTLFGSGGNDTLDGGTGSDVMAGGAGDDIYIVDNAGDLVVEQFNAGIDHVYSSISYVLPENVENLTLTGTDAINGSGNALDNVIVGNVAANVLDGGMGADTLIGGTGDDTYIVDNAGDVVVENLNEGNDSVFASMSYALSDNVENLTLTGTDAIDGSGNDLDNLIVGNAANNVLDGGAGADTLIGGAGDDTYIVDNVNDTVTEQSGEGVDTVLSSVSYGLSANVENLTLTGTENLSGTGNSLDNVLIGNAGNNVLLGEAGNDTLFGSGGNDLLDGGTGADAMAGGVGDDTYIVDNVGDAVTELASEGFDTVYSSIDYTLGANVENLSLTGTDNLSGAGNELDNTILGNAGNNFIDGAAGADSMAGGAGDDIYIVDNAGDLVVEQFNEGLDHVYSSISYVLPQNVENLTLTSFDAINGTGNDLDNIIVGNVANNVLDGGAGADTLIGGAGDDTYIVDNVNDMVTEQSGEGIDTVLSSVSYGLSANVENLTLTGSDAIDGTGNTLDNIIIGNGADNRLIGNAGNDSLFGNAGNDVLDGGTGNDILDGGSGDDVYLWRKGDGLDTIADTGGNDTVQFGDALNLDNLALRVTSENGILTAHVRALDDCGCEMDDQGFDFAVGVDANGGYVSPIEQFRLADGTLLTFDDLLIKTVVTLVRPGRQADHDGDGHHGHHSDSGRGWIHSGKGDHDSGFGTDKYEENDPRLKQIRLTDGSRLHWDDLPGGILVATVNPRNRTVVTGRNDDMIFGSANSETIYAGTGNDIVFASAGKDTLYGEGGNDALLGGNGADTLIGGCGYDILSGGEGKDVLIAGDENNLLLGGNGNDRILAGAGNDFIAGGRGDDTITTGAGDNTVAFNREDGHDTILASAGAHNTLSLGEDLEYRDLGFMRSGDDLVLDAGHHDAITFKDWYASPDNRTFFTLQTIEEKSDDWDDWHISSDKSAFVTHHMINKAGTDTVYDKKVDLFDFQKLVDSFDHARAANPGLTRWNLMNGLLDAHLGGSDNAALGGEFAYEYGQSGSLAQVGISAAQTALKDSGFGGMQTLKPFQGLTAEIAIGR